MQFKYWIFLYTLGCESTDSFSQNNLTDQWWDLDGDNIDFNIFLESNEIESGTIWYSEYTPYLYLNDNEYGGLWELSSNELKIELSEVLKQKIVDEGISPIAPKYLFFSITNQDACYNVKLERLPIVEQATACQYEGYFF